MSAEEIYFFTNVWLIIAATIIVAAAALLIAIIIAAKRITRLAMLALEIVGDIEQSTKPIWQLNDTQQVAGNLQAGARAILASATDILSALHAAERKDDAA